MGKRKEKAAATGAAERGVGNGGVWGHPPQARWVKRSDSGDAFFPDPEGGPAQAPDDLAETLAEDFLQSATTGNDVDDEVMNQIVPEEIGGPFIETSSAEEFADGVDESNPEDAEVEGLPLAMHGMVEKPPL